MAHIVPSISFLKTFRSALEGGVSVASALDEAIGAEKTSFSVQVYLWYCDFQKQGLSGAELFHTHYQKSFMDIVANGLSGAPVYEHLKLLEVAMEAEFERQWKAYLSTLPSKLSIPLLLFFFPAYVILLFGPLITQFLNEVN